MGEGPKDVKSDDSRWDVTPSEDVTGRGEGDVVGRPMADTPSATSAPGYAGAIRPAETIVPPTTAGSTGIAGTTPPGVGTGYTGSATGGTTDDTSQIRAEIEQTRANITDTVEEITNRLSPRNIAADATEATRERVRHFTDAAGERAREIAVQTRHATDRAVDTARENPWVTAAAVAGIGAAAWWLMSRRDDVSEYDVDYYTEESLYYDDVDDDIVNYDERVERMDSNKTMGVAVPIVLAGIGVGAWLLNRRSGQHESHGSGSPLGASQNSWGDVGYGEEAGSYRSFEGAGSSWGDEASSAADRARGTMSDAADKARGAVSDAAERARGAVSGAAGRARHAANDAAERARHAASDAAERARHAASDVGDRTRGLAVKARRQVGQAGQRAKNQLEHWMDDNPLACGAVAMAVGVAVGLAVPESRREHRLMGNTRDRLMGRAQAAASGAVDRAKGAAREAVDAAKEAAGETMDKSKESAQNAVSDIQRDMTKA